ncbi:hypothetical protein AU210_003626 [Fusarium oxysporum f. sp. radicis-cucumerinum]|uniref:Uncharacterized protein n=1 Tax=Fusarium oxysporum f. sp. radicis-cucumerinum TaxID=327505 RepID=A0A2H3HK05_FUSOX|nr:hypothetical protein AU210_003626 [Fusarium oxysporum f. sp. radicis-cucumerinum]
MSSDEGKVRRVLDDSNGLLKSVAMKMASDTSSHTRSSLPAPKAADPTSVVLHVSEAPIVQAIQNWQTYHFTSTKTISAYILPVPTSVYVCFLITRER